MNRTSPEEAGLNRTSPEKSRPEQDQAFARFSPERAQSKPKAARASPGDAHSKPKASPDQSKNNFRANPK